MLNPALPHSTQPIFLAGDAQWGLKNNVLRIWNVQCNLISSNATKQDIKTLILRNLSAVFFSCGNAIATGVIHKTKPTHFKINDRHNKKQGRRGASAIMAPLTSIFREPHRIFISSGLLLLLLLLLFMPAVSCSCRQHSARSPLDIF